MIPPTNRFKCSNWMVIVGAIFALGYTIIFFSMLFGKSSEYSDIVETELAEINYDNNFLKKQISEKDSEIKRLMKLLGDKAGAIPEPEAAVHNPNDNAVRPGVIILGMHRSGTSVLGGLMNKMGLKTGGPLIAPAQDNEKGFFERVDVVLQNDEFMQKQGVHYAYSTFKYDAMAAVKDMMTGQVKFKEGERGLAFLNEPSNAPWMLKDPRLCITIRTWIPLLSAIPAVVFTYRHPLDVALSMHKRETEHFKVARGLKMWYVYNRRAIEQTHDLCRVTTSHRKVMSQAEIELERIYTELHQCGVAVPHMVEKSDINSFIDIKLQHGRSTLKDTSCGGDISTLTPPESWPTTDNEHVSLYRECMRVYCALEDGTALKPSFEWDRSIRDN